MGRGRKPDPAGLQDAKGNPGRRPAQTETPDAPPARLSAPKELSKDAVAIWTKLAGDLSSLNILRDTDRAAFMRYCENLAAWWKCTRDIRAKKYTYWTDSQHGKMERVRPIFLVRERLEKRLEAAEDRFGLNPAARQQLMRNLAGLAPAPVGGLFDNKDQPNAANSSGPEVEPASPIGILGNNGSSVH